MKKSGRPFMKWTRARRLTALAFFALLLLGGRDWFPWFSGTTTAGTLVDAVPFTDPLAALEILLASGTLEFDCLVGALILLLVCLLMGPVFCGWICPLGLLLDLIGSLRRAVLRLSRGRVRGGRSPDLPPAVRIAALGLVLGFSLVAGLPAFQTVSPINLLAWMAVLFPDQAVATEGGLGAESAALLRALVAAGGALLILLGLIVAAELVSPRLWCRRLCPLGALYALVGRAGLFKAHVVRAGACLPHCGLCADSCPVAIEVRSEYVASGNGPLLHADCTRCGACVDVCPRDVLRLGFGPGREKGDDRS